jgi:hypothetical protein
MPKELMQDVFADAEKYLSVAYLAIGAHVDQLPTEAIESLVAMLQVELRERDETARRCVSSQRYW